MDHDLTQGSGWLSPDGKLHKCYFGNHEERAANVHLRSEEYTDEGEPFSDSASEILERKGWIKVQHLVAQEPDHVEYGGTWYVTALQYLYITTSLKPCLSELRIK